jgi:hypothetical protein
MRGDHLHVGQRRAGRRHQEVPDREDHLGGDLQGRLVDQQIERRAHRALDRVLDRQQRPGRQPGLHRRRQRRDAGEADQLAPVPGVRERRLLAERPARTQERRRHQQP